MVKISASPDETLASLDEIFSHSFSTSAWNMCVIPIEESTPQILVQSIDCKLSLFQGDQCVFSMVPLRALQPGPIGYCQTTQTLFVANNGFLAAIKFSLMSSGSQKKINVSCGLLNIFRMSNIIGKLKSIELITNNKPKLSNFDNAEHFFKYADFTLTVNLSLLFFSMTGLLIWVILQYK